MASTNSIPNGGPPPRSTPTIETDLLVIGTGPAGASLACFLASYDLKGIMISTAPGTAKEPRAHITNPAALECLRDIGLEEEVLRLATPGDCMQHTRWCHSMAGEEFGRIYSWGNDPARHGDYDAASPCRHVDLPQTLLEPVLVKRALAKGWTCRFDSSFVSFERESPTAPITSTIKDNLTNQTYTIRSKYLFGCDGARSQVMRQLDLPLVKQPGQGLAINVHVEADLSHLVKYRNGNLHYMVQPDVEHPEFGWSCINRVIKPWHEWMFIFLPKPGFDFSVERPEPSEKQYVQRVREFIGDASVEVKLIDVAKWYIREVVAERYSDGNIFCLGDAVHRHPPLNGLGSNTCIQDAFNLAWKLSHVLRGLAKPSLLDTFSAERQPIGKAIVTRANQGLRDHVPIWDALGALPEDVQERRRQFAELGEGGEAGVRRRRMLKEGIEGTAHEFSAIGVEMNQRYESGAVYLKDEKEAHRPPPQDAVLEYQLSTYPGSRLPHAWLNKRIPAQPISTIDLAGHGAFTLLTGPGGDEWKAAAYEACRYLNVTVNAYSIGWKCDWEDVYCDWARRREVSEDGCVLVRPDRTICWRSFGMREDCKAHVLLVLRTVLGRA